MECMEEINNEKDVTARNKCPIDMFIPHRYTDLQATPEKPQKGGFKWLTNIHTSAEHKFFWINCVTYISARKK